MLRKDWRRIPTDWYLRPHFQFCPPQRRKAILWLLAHLVMYRMQQQRQLSLLDYIEFLRRARWKSYRPSSRMQQVGNYRYSRQCPLYRRGTKEGANRCQLGHGLGERNAPNRWSEAVQVWVLDDTVGDTHYQNSRQKGCKFLHIWLKVRKIFQKKSRWRRHFPHFSRPALVPTQLSVKRYRVFPGGKQRTGRDADPSPPF